MSLYIIWYNLELCLLNLGNIVVFQFIFLSPLINFAKVSKTEVLSNIPYLLNCIFKPHYF